MVWVVAFGLVVLVLLWLVALAVVRHSGQLAAELYCAEVRPAQRESGTNPVQHTLTRVRRMLPF